MFQRASLLSLVITVAVPTCADECDLAGAALAAVPGVSGGERTRNHIVKFHHWAVSEMSIGCAMERSLPMELFLAWDGAYPPNDFYVLAGKAGHAVIGGAASAISTGAQRCQKKALGSKDELAQTAEGGVGFECQAFSRDGGGTTISIYRVPPGE